MKVSDLKALMVVKEEYEWEINFEVGDTSVSNAYIFKNLMERECEMIFNPAGLGITVKIQETNAEHFEAAFGYKPGSCVKPDNLSSCYGKKCSECDYRSDAPYHERRENK